MSTMWIRELAMGREFSSGLIHQLLELDGQERGDWTSEEVTSALEDYRGELDDEVVAAFTALLNGEPHDLPHPPSPLPAPGPEPQGPASLIIRYGGDMLRTTASQFFMGTLEVDGVKRQVPWLSNMFDQLTFVKSTVPAAPDGSNLKPGTAGWLDRPMKPDEPDRVVSSTDMFLLSSGLQFGNGSTIASWTKFTTGVLDRPNGTVLSVEVMRPAALQFEVIKGTQPKTLS